MGDTVLFGRYRLLEPAGAGGSAAVWRALDEQTGDEVAVKRLHPVVLADADARRRLVLEFAALRRVHDPRIVRVRDLHLENGDAALVLDYVDGASLAERLALDGALPVDDALGIARDVAGALAAAHRAGIVHRDVTPGNILLDRSGRAHLTDFGIAQRSDGATALTATGSVVGTLRYVAPEQLRGEEATPQSDIHALGAVVYEMLAGRPAYPAPTAVALAEQQAAGPAPIEGVPESLDAAVRAALAPDPTERPDSALAFAASLDAAVAHEVPGEAAGSTAPDAQTAVFAVPVAPVARPAGRRPLPAGAAVAAAVLVAAIALAALAGPPDRTRVASEPSAAPSAPAESAPASAAPSPIVTPEPEPVAGPGDADGGGGKGKGGGNGNGKGKGKGPDR